ncbi:MAG: HAD-IC family P-type ATPase [Deltaproteobacteria bacterium]|nr:HAD-IC family P-type ATPase [Deltaproteobacteria bacterium]
MEEAEVQAPWHATDIEALLAAFRVDPERGLDAAQVSLARERFGRNALPVKKSRGLAGLVLAQFRSPLIYLLFLAAALAFLLGERLDAAVILGVLCLNALIGSIQEGRAERSMEALRRLGALRVRVLREGREISLESSELVPGDILLLASGDAVGADARLLSVFGLSAQEAALTGESLPVEKGTEALPPEVLPAERRNMVFAGTHVAAGRGRALVVATGLDTEAGKIATLTESAEEPKTPLELRIAQIGRWLLYASPVLLLAIVGVGLWHRLGFEEIFLVGLSQVVSMVPEGLPVAMTVALAVGMQRMARHGAIVRQLSAVETLGSTKVVCTDKTGTLTKNEMTVVALRTAGGELWEVTGSGYAPEGEIRRAGCGLVLAEAPEVRELLLAAVLCNDARLLPPGPEEPRWSLSGDPTEGSLLSLAEKAGLRKSECEASFPRCREIPFDSEIKMMATQHGGPVGPVIYLKGAPEVLLEYCGGALGDGGETRILDEAGRRRILQEGAELAGRALRLLAFAEVPASEGDLSRGLESLRGRARFLGLVGQMDPPRPEVRRAVALCRSAGIRPIMVTGDHKATGLAIARELDIARDGDLALDGRELEALSEEEFRARLERISVYARVYPAQKLRIVQAWQARDAVVAMTGDGVNDAPALAQADVGVAMGLTGTEVAKAAAKIVLTDDNFATIVRAVEEGRLVFRNIVKTLLYLLSTNLSEVVLLLAALTLDYPLPLAAVQILWVNLVTDGTMTIPLAMTPLEGDEMAAPPIPRRARLLSGDFLRRMAVMVLAMSAATLAYFLLRVESGMPFDQVRTGTFTLLVVCQWFNALNCLSERHSVFAWKTLQNYWFWGGWWLGNLLQMAVIFWEPLQVLFRTVALPWSEALLIGAAGSLVLWAEELRKWLARRRLRA